jgi:hypothetical protein
VHGALGDQIDQEEAAQSGKSQLKIWNWLTFSTNAAVDLKLKQMECDVLG